MIFTLKQKIQFLESQGFKVVHEIVDDNETLTVYNSVGYSLGFLPGSGKVDELFDKLFPEFLINLARG